MILGYGILFLFLVSASLYDLWQYRVPNVLCITALIVSLFRHLELQGISGIVPWFLGIIIPFILCYLFFLCHMLGAGDSKVLSAIGSFVGIRLLVRILILSIALGAVMSLVKMVIHRNGLQRFRRFFQYITLCKQMHTYLPYYDKEVDGEESVIPFTIAISTATIWCLFY